MVVGELVYEASMVKDIIITHIYEKDHPYAKDLCEGQIVTAGDVIGYLGMTGYSSHENVNNINIPHLHFGVQLIFNEVQKDGNNQIWIDVYEIIEYLKKKQFTGLYGISRHKGL